ncbi:hypothetical protein LJB83_03110 [Clostridia bacterium OttesenSCG-928-F22]|nr:hypothetical protein [Clostridia bacterium OttesenSCG-928-F22]
MMDANKQYPFFIRSLCAGGQCPLLITRADGVRFLVRGGVVVCHGICEQARPAT